MERVNIIDMGKNETEDKVAVVGRMEQIKKEHAETMFQTMNTCVS